MLLWTVACWRCLSIDENAARLSLFIRRRISMRLFSEGGTARVRSVDVWELGSIWQHPAETK